MRTFKESKKGCIGFNGKSYYLKIDSFTLTLIMADTLPKMEGVRLEAEQLQVDFEAGKFDNDTYIDEINAKFDKLKKHNERFCKLILGDDAFSEIVDGCNAFTFEDLQTLVNMPIQELTDIKQSQNNDLVGDL